MAIAYVADGAYASAASSSGAATLTLAFPAGVANDNLVLAAVCASSQIAGANIGTPTGWVKVGDTGDNLASGYNRLFLFAAMYGAGLTSTFVSTGQGANNGIDGTIKAFSGTASTVGQAIGNFAFVSPNSNALTAIPGPTGFTSGQWNYWCAINYVNPASPPTSSPTMANTFYNAGVWEAFFTGSTTPGSAPGTETITWLTAGNWLGVGATILPPPIAVSGIQYVGDGGYTTAAQSAGTCTLALPFPGGIANGQAVVAYVSCQDTTLVPTVATPTGWTQLGFVTGNNDAVYLFGAIYSPGLTGTFIGSNFDSSGMSGNIRSFSGTGGTVASAFGAFSSVSPNSTNTLIPAPTGFTNGQWNLWGSTNYANQSFTSASPVLSNVLYNAGSGVFGALELGTTIPTSQPGTETFTWLTTGNFLGVGLTILPGSVNAFTRSSRHGFRRRSLAGHTYFN